MFGFGTKIGQKVNDDGNDDAEQISQPHSSNSHLTLTILLGLPMTLTLNTELAK